MMKFARRRAVQDGSFICLGLVWLALSSGVAWGQFGVPGTSTSPTSAFQIIPRELRQELSRAAKASEEQRFAEAAGLLGELLQQNESEDYFIDPSGGASFKGEAQRLISALPKAGRESYELQFGAEARVRLAAALDEGDDTKLADVVRKYFDTSAGHEAALLYARQALDAGQPLAAAVILERLSNQGAEVARFEPELALLTAISWRMGGRRDEAAAVLMKLQQSQANRPLVVGGQRAPKFADAVEALAWLDPLLGTQAVGDGTPVSEWEMHRGDPSRNGKTTGSMPISMYRWHKYLGRDENEDDLLAREAKNFQNSNVAALPVLSPLVVNDTVLMRTADRLMAVDINSGKYVWRYPWGDERSEEEDASSSRFRPANGPSLRQRELGQRVWEDCALGELVSDGELVFMLDEVGYALPGSAPVIFVRPGGARTPNPGQPTDVNKLIAISLAKEGKLRWSVGGDTGDNEPELAGAFFLGAPLVFEGSLYAIAEINGELRLVVIEATSGKLQWSQQLAHVDTMTITKDNHRRLAGARPSLADGVLVCPTSACSVVAVDLNQRKLMWGYRYNSVTNRSGGQWNYYAIPPRPIGTHWIDSTATIAKGRVLITPSEADELICLDLVTGKPVWKPRARADELSDMLYVACIHDGKAILVGKTSVLALKMSDGTAAWDDLFTLDGEMPSGRGFYADHFYYLPTSRAELLKIDLNTGKIASRGSTGRVLGNLVCYRDQLVSQSFDGVSTFYQSEALRELVDRRLKEEPEDPTALAQQGQILLHDGKTEDALTVLRKAYDRDQGNDDTRLLLVRTLLEALKRDFTTYKTLAIDIEPLLDQPQQRREFLRLKAIGLQKSGELAAAFAAYVDLAQVAKGERPDMQLGGASMEVVDPQLRVRFDRWLQTRLQELYVAADAKQRGELDAVIAKACSLPAQSATADAWQQIVRHFGWHPQSDLARVELAALRLESNEWLAAEILLTKFTLPGDERLLAGHANALLAGHANALLATLYHKLGRDELAAAALARLRRHWPDTVVYNGQTGTEIFKAAQQNKELPTLLSQGHAWPTGKVSVKEGPDVVASGIGYAVYQRVYPMPMVESRGALAQGAAFTFDMARSQLVLRDGLGNEVNQVSLTRPDSRRPIAPQTGLAHAHTYGHLTLVSLGQELVAVDMLRNTVESSESTLWRQDLLPPNSDTNGTLPPVRGQVVPYTWTLPRSVPMFEPDRVIGAVAALSEQAVCYAKKREVVCVDPLTGETLWERSQTEPGTDLFGDEEIVFLVPPRGSEATVLSVADGRVLGQRHVDRLDFRWQTCGRNVLSCRQDGREIIATLYDAWSEKTLWTKRFAFGSRGTLIGRDEMAMMQPSGELLIVNLATGEVVLDTKLSPEPKLLNIFALRSPDQYFVQMETIINQADEIAGTSIQPAPGGDYTKIVTGPLYAFDRATMKPSWQSPAFISQFGFMLDQPAELPFLFFLRHKQPTAGRGPEKQQTSVMAIDRRDGRMIFERDNIPIAQTNVYELVGNRANNTIELSLSSVRSPPNVKLIEFKLTDEPIPPAPPAQMGSASSLIAQASSADKLNAFGRALEAGLRNAADDLNRAGAGGTPVRPPLPPGFPPGLVPQPRRVP